MITVEAKGVEQVHAALAGEFDCQLADDALQRAAIAEHIRALVFGSWTRSGTDAAPVHTTRILTNARRVQRFVWPQHLWKHGQLGDLCRQVLDSLAILGDVVSVGNGLWIPGPNVFVELDGVDHLMVTGGLPSQVARTHFATPIMTAKPSQSVSLVALPVTRLSPKPFPAIISKETVPLTLRQQPCLGRSQIRIFRSKVSGGLAMKKAVKTGSIAVVGWNA
jgi:hypothetical protein